jgi:hypothetical protein
MSYDELYNLALWLFQKEPANKGKQMLIYEILQWQDQQPKQKRETVYLVAKVSGVDKREVQHKYEEAKKIVSGHGYYPISPIDHVPDSASWHEAMRICIPLMLSCNYYTLVDDPLTTVGGFIEETLAQWTKFPKLHFNEFEK